MQLEIYFIHSKESVQFLYTTVMFLFVVNLWICFLLTGKSPHAAHFSLLGYLTYKEVFFTPLLCTENPFRHHPRPPTASTAFPTLQTQI